MKNFTKIFLITFAIIITGCNEEDLNIDPNKVSEVSLFNSEDGFEQATIGVYQKLRTFYYWRNEPMHALWLLPDDNLTTLGDRVAEAFSAINPENGQVRDFYAINYQLINRANIILEKIENVKAGVFSSEQKKNQLKGEVLFMRSYANFLLWNFYGGGAPLVLERARSFDEITPESSGGNALLNKAIEDLNTAKDLLPVEWPSEQLGRVTKNAANALLGKALLFRGTVEGNNQDYSEALNAFNRISGVSLAEKYQDNFSAFDENNEESIFEVQVGDRFSTTSVWGDDDGNPNGTIAGFWGFFNNGYFMWNNPRFVPTQALIDTYEDGDPRKEFTIVEETDDDELQIGKYVTDDAYITQRPEGRSLSINNPRLIRYADVMLMKAEAIVRTGGNLSEAISLVNEIRERARMSTEDGMEAAAPMDRPDSETDPATVLDWIMEERRIELAAEEGHRWFDLRRMHLAGEIDLTNWEFSSLRNDFQFRPRNIYLPIPAFELELNPNLDQNEGF